MANRSHYPIEAVFACGALRPALLTLAATLPLLMACATSDFSPADDVRPPEAVPTRFMVGTFENGQVREPSAGEGCRSPMVDPGDGTQLLLIRSSRDRGDYEVPDGKYGARKGELLRLNCSTGEPIGLVAR